jgi:hypothetical protein
MRVAEAFFTILVWETRSHFGVGNDCIRRQERRCYECDEKSEKGLQRAVIIELVDVADETCRYDPGFAFSIRAPARDRFAANFMVYRFDALH